MTPTEKARRAEALYQDKTKRELADMVVHRESDLEDARAENAKLQNDADLLRSMLQAKRKDTHALMSENAELRETLHRRTEHLKGMYEMWVERGVENHKLRTALSAVLQCSGITKRDKGCDACPMYDKEKEYVWAGDWCGIRQFIRELGVEVDG